MQILRSPQDVYRKVDLDARIAGADPQQLVLLCYEQLGTALGSAVHAAQAGDNARKSAALTRALSAITALQMGLDTAAPVSAALATFLDAARHTVLGTVIAFDAPALERLKSDVTELAAAFRQAGSAADKVRNG
ncbi:MAG TPA: flagellar protein FliS [Novosphingobium sp.]|nr:flagellar protein FliS [Novosphingobium sp.]